MKKLYELRTEAGLTQKQLGEAIGYSQRSISNWEKDIAEPNIENLKALAKYFKISIDYLLGLEDDFGAKEFDAPKIEHYSKAERELIATYRALSPGKKSALFEMLEIDTTAEKGKNQKLS